jgi:hypothetical protein
VLRPLERWNSLRRWLTSFWTTLYCVWCSEKTQVRGNPAMGDGGYSSARNRDSGHSAGAQSYCSLRGVELWPRGDHPSRATSTVHGSCVQVVQPAQQLLSVSRRTGKRYVILGLFLSFSLIHSRCSPARTHVHLLFPHTHTHTHTHARALSPSLTKETQVRLGFPKSSGKPINRT